MNNSMGFRKLYKDVKTSTNYTKFNISLPMESNSSIFPTNQIMDKNLEKPLGYINDYIIRYVNELSGKSG